MPTKHSNTSAGNKSRGKTRAPVDVNPKIVPLLMSWFAKHARELPWRETNRATGLRDAYQVLVSEVMLQQTQVSRVEPKFLEFLERFPTVRDLAAAHESDVLAAWTGLGYYRRARMLHAAAKRVAAEFDGNVPSQPDQLREMPGIGDYTTGAIASLAFGKPEPLVDTNVSRVLLRIAGRKSATTEPQAREWCWEQARVLVNMAHAMREQKGSGIVINRAGVFNESLMELGAMVCTSAAPACERCPLASVCEARRQGTQSKIPRAAAPKKRSAITHAVLVLRDKHGRVLVEPRSGAKHKNALWEGLWQAPTLECELPPRSVSVLAPRLGISRARAVGASKTHDFVFKTTLRDVRFVVWDAIVAGGADLVTTSQRCWKPQKELLSLALSSPMRRILLGVAQ